MVKTFIVGGFMKKNIVLADNSYTIRRIVELSFSDEEDIELISYENGADIQDKLLELKPSVVLVDIKLPEMNGYEVCRFINQSSELKNTKVFLIKGGFEPVDEEQLNGLKYEDFITKPFDSKALVITIKSLLDDIVEEGPPAEPVDIPASMPEDISEISGIDDMMEKPESIDFSDVSSEMESGGLVDTINAPDSETSIKDEVLPSEEITQGSGIDDSEDNLSPEVQDDISNPFKEEPAESADVSEEEAAIKENIKMQEEELEIDSLTMEEINIQKEIDQKKGIDSDVSSPVDREISPPAEPATPEIKEEPAAPVEEKLLREDEKDPLDPSLSNMDSSDLENVFSIGKDQDGFGDAPPAESMAAPKEDPKEETKEETREKSEEIKQVLEQLENDPPREKEESSKEDTSEKVIDRSLSEKLAGLSGLEGNTQFAEKIEDKLTVSVKEILWEIVPPLAEKVIQSEIDKLKSDIDKEYK